MYPTLFHIGPLVIHTYGVFVAIGFIAGFKVLLNYTERIGIPAQKVESLVMWIFIFSIIGARLFYVVLTFGDFRYSPLDAFKIWQGGLFFSGGAAGGFAAAAVYISRNKLPLAKLADAGSVALALGQAIGRIGCFFAGCCYGVECDCWCGMKFPENSLAPSGVKLIPTQVISSLLLFLIFFVLAGYNRRKKTDGQVCALYLVLYGVKRFCIEFLRGDFRGRAVLGLTPTQYIALAMFAGGIFSWKKLSSKKTSSG